MQHKHYKRIRTVLSKHTHKSVMTMAAAYLVVLLLPLAFTTHVAFADGDADFSLTPSEGTYAVGQQVTVTVSETSSAADNAGSLFAGLLYQTDMLQYDSSANGSFAPCDIQPATGEVYIDCTSTTPVAGGTLPVATVTFTVLSAGDISISLDPNSDIDDINGNSIWDDEIPMTSYTAVTPGSSSAGSSDSTPGTSSGSSPVGASPAGASSTQSTTTSPTPSTQQSVVTASKYAVLALSVTGNNDKPIKGAKVSVDNSRSLYTNASGEVAFSRLTLGPHTLTVSAPGMVMLTTTLRLSANEDKRLSLRAASQNVSPAVVAYIAVGLTVLGVAGFMFARKVGFSGQRRLRRPTIPGIVVGTGLLTPMEASIPNPVKPVAPARPGIVTPGSPEGVVMPPDVLPPPKS